MFYALAVRDALSRPNSSAIAPPDDGTLEEVRIVARVQHCGIGERELAKIVFGDEARSVKQLTTLRSGVTARAEQKLV